jgi:hypothetical protein
MKSAPADFISNISRNPVKTALYYCWFRSDRVRKVKNPGPEEQVFNVRIKEGETMIAYYVHDEKKENDVIIIPDRECRIPVDRQRLEAFIAVDPVFASWPGDACGLVSPEDFGVVIATRDDGGDVCVMDHKLWRERMEHYLGAP